MSFMNFAPDNSDDIITVELTPIVHWAFTTLSDGKPNMTERQTNFVETAIQNARGQTPFSEHWLRAAEELAFLMVWPFEHHTLYSDGFIWASSEKPLP